MKCVDTIARIRREFFVAGKTIKQIVRELHASRNTVRKVVRTGATAFEYEREHQPRPRIGPWKTELDRLLASNENKAARERLTLIRLFEELRGLGYDGGYDAVRRYARTWRKAHASSSAAAFVPLSFAPGEAYQFDWSHDVVLINGTTVTVKVAHVRLCHSRMLFVRAAEEKTNVLCKTGHRRDQGRVQGTVWALHRRRVAGTSQRPVLRQHLARHRPAFHRDSAFGCRRYRTGARCRPQGGTRLGQDRYNDALKYPPQDRRPHGGQSRGTRAG